MKITLTGQRPTTLDPLYTASIAGDYDPYQLLTDRVVTPLFTPITNQNVAVLKAGTSQPVQLNGVDFNEDTLLELLYSSLGEKVDVQSEELLKQLYTQGLVHYDPNNNLLSNAVYAVQAATKNKLPSPSPTVVYTAATDVIPSAKALLGQPDLTNEEIFFTSLAHSYRPETLGFWFQSSQDFNDFKDWFQNECNLLIPTGTLDSTAITLIGEFAKVDLKNLTEGLMLRKDENDQNQEGSFARLVIHLLMQYQSQQRNLGVDPTMGVLPFHLGELLIPKTLLFVNLEAHSRANPRKIDNEWRLINAMLGTKIRVISSNKLSKLTAMPRAQARANAIASMVGREEDARSAAIRFRKKPPTSIDISKGVIRALKRMKEVNRSRNVFKKTKKSFLRANRRHPDDFNRPGTMVSHNYFPDIHIFLDTSGSISEDNYQDAIQMLIYMAKKMNVDLYFSSFSHILSQPSLLKTKDRSLNNIWKDFQKIPKVTGGTNYSQIWDFINAHPARKDRFSLIVTDFEWWAPTRAYEHPKNLYYAPVSGMNWNRIISNAKSFAKSMQHIDPAVAQKMIGVVI